MLFAVLVTAIYSILDILDVHRVAIVQPIHEPKEVLSPLIGLTPRNSSLMVMRKRSLGLSPVFGLLTPGQDNGQPLALDVIRLKLEVARDDVVDGQGRGGGGDVCSAGGTSEVL